MRSNLAKQGWFLKRWSGSSGKKISENLCLSFWGVLLSGGNRTWWISNDGGIGISVWVWVLVSSSSSSFSLSWQSKCSTLLQFTPIICSVLFSLSVFNLAVFLFEKQHSVGCRFIEEGHGTPCYSKACVCLSRAVSLLFV